MDARPIREVRKHGRDLFDLAVAMLVPGSRHTTIPARITAALSTHRWRIRFRSSRSSLQASPSQGTAVPYALLTQRTRFDSPSASRSRSLKFLFTPSASSSSPLPNESTRGQPAGTMAFTVLALTPKVAATAKDESHGFWNSLTDASTRRRRDFLRIKPFDVIRRPSS
jgi:hypothetical protein